MRNQLTENSRQMQQRTWLLVPALFHLPLDALNSNIVPTAVCLAWVPLRCDMCPGQRGEQWVKFKRFSSDCAIIAKLR